MDINVTLFGQMITFVLFVAFTMKYVWPPLTKALDERRKRIADGLASADKGVRELREASAKADKLLKEAREQAQEVLNNANRQAAENVEHSKEQARAEGERIVTAARAEVAQEVAKAKEELRQQVGTLAVTAASQILRKEIDAKAHQSLLDKIAANV